MYQGNPNTNALFSYTRSGRYNLIQTVENICGFATQTILIEITLAELFQKTKIEKVIRQMPFLIEGGSDIVLDIPGINLVSLLKSTLFEFYIIETL
jgi:hypothetical protein